MNSKGIRGAITVDANTAEEIESATNELLKALIEENEIEKELISHVLFTLTSDLNAAFPAKFARINFGWENVAMLCHNELDVPGALPKCMRILIVLNCYDDREIKHIYLKGATALRPDLKN